MSVSLREEPRVYFFHGSAEYIHNSTAADTASKASQELTTQINIQKQEGFARLKELEKIKKRVDSILVLISVHHLCSPLVYR